MAALKDLDTRMEQLRADRARVLRRLVLHRVFASIGEEGLWAQRGLAYKLEMGLEFVTVEGIEVSGFSSDWDLVWRVTTCGPVPLMTFVAPSWAECFSKDFCPIWAQLIATCTCA